jgi:hypothetical protein
MTASQWHHVVVTYHVDGTSRTVLLYQDGIRQGRATYTGGDDIDWGTFTMGTINTGVANFNGDIAKFAIYSRLLTSSEILRNCNAGLTRFSGSTCN